ncbi:sugar-binding transcriptional regulator [Rubellimicrobium aerolatum]|uniref:Sugar-binding transcriptional regulator n=1 Tax=Rubellimicrobium aerolatum TaxID=490979 RepID=A0ABW0SF48_9RHOB|nr:sugar-binding domain-containing protein [Rubellimicrobium aerolatum]MBP1807079.1 DNA-binding transcriptional regulator LsrR (DeoR family) [Rubellimicrobium aerolatum]
MASGPVLEESEEFLVRLAWMYFVDGLTQSEIAERLGVTRLRVNRGIGLAKGRGLVRVEMASPFAAALDLQARLVERWGLRFARVGLADRRTDDGHQAVAAALAYFLEDGLGRGAWSSIGVSWGSTIENAIRSLRPRHLPGLEVVSMIGGTMSGVSFNTFGVAANLAARLGARHSVLAAPIYFETQGMTEAVLASRPFREQLEKAGRVDLAILVTGDLSPRSYLVRDGLPVDVTLGELAGHGAVGDVLGQFLDREGRVIDHPINRRVVGVPVERLRAMREVVLAAAGAHKVPVIAAQLRAGLVHGLVTDDMTAELLLAEGR